MDCEFGSLAVPVRRDARAREDAAIAFVRLRSPGPGSNTVIYLEGGPGIPVVRQAEDPDSLRRWLDLLSVGDVVLLDHRGCGRSIPSLSWKWPGSVPAGVFATRQQALAHVLEMSRQARAHLLARGVDPEGFTAEECADDIEDLRLALGLERVSLLGFSFGAQLALACLRRHPQSVSRVVAAGVEGPPHALKLPLGLDDHLRSLGLLEPARRAVRRLESDPPVIDVELRGSQTSLALPVGRFGLGLVLREWLGHRDFVESLPPLLAGITDGDPRLLAERVRRSIGPFLRANVALHLIDGSSGASEPRRREIERQSEESLFGNAVNFPFPEIDGVWRPRDAGEAYRSIVTSDRPALLLSGSLDWNAPPHQAEEMLRGLSRGTHHVVRGATHLEILSDPEARRLAIGFLAGDD